jgi:hypothetical protein
MVFAFNDFKTTEMKSTGKLRDAPRDVSSFANVQKSNVDVSWERLVVCHASLW